MKLTGTSDDVLPGLGDPSLDAWVGFGETLETFNELGEVRSVLDLDGNLDDGGDGEFHDLHVVRSLRSGESTALEQELVDSDETNDVTGGAVFEGLDTTTHHEDGALDGLDKQVIFLSWKIVGALDADLGASTNGTREDASKGIETTLIRGRDHLRDIQDQRSLRVAIADTNGGLVIHGPLVEGLDTVRLSGGGGGEIDDDHFEEGVSGRQKFPHYNFQERLSLKLLLLWNQFDLELLEHFGGIILLEFHNGVEDLVDRIQYERVESTGNGLVIVRSALGGPLLGSRVEKVVAPEPGHHLLLIDTELFGVTVGKLAEGEGPSMETGAEGYSALVGVDLDITKSVVIVSGDDDIDSLDGT